MSHRNRNGPPKISFSLFSCPAGPSTTKPSRTTHLAPPAAACVYRRRSVSWRLRPRMPLPGTIAATYAMPHRQLCHAPPHAAPPEAAARHHRRVLERLATDPTCPPTPTSRAAWQHPPPTGCPVSLPSIFSCFFH
jgi:hypothetical protein